MIHHLQAIVVVLTTWLFKNLRKLFNETSTVNIWLGSFLVPSSSDWEPEGSRAEDDLELQRTRQGLLTHFGINTVFPFSVHFNCFGMN